ncbi:MAG: DUF2207 domain-containing protein [Chloroflexi bacterium]|nr:MAG: DUF2207 domain-containing protein [Chloroflexota bacterium]
MYGVDQEKAKARPYEETVYTKIFGFQGGRKRKLSDVRRTLYMSVPEIKNQIDVEIARAGYFPEHGSNIRRQYLAFGGAAIILSFLLGLLFVAIFSQFTFLVICPFLSLIATAFAFIVAGFAAPRHTQAGATEAVRWQAFRRYLQTIDKQGAVKSRIRFARLLPYATAFGFEKEFTAKFSRVKTPAPKWWSIPPAKLPDTQHQDAHAWVSTSDMARTPTTPKTELPGQAGRPAIRRLGAEKDGPTGPLLKDIQSEFSQFMAQGLAAFSKAPTLDEDEEIDFDSLGKE